MSLSRSKVAAWRVAVMVVGLGAWEWASDRLIPSFYVSKPSAIATRLYEVFVTGQIFPHLLATFIEIFAGFAIGLPMGLLVGLVLGSWRFGARVFQPFLILLYSMPLLALAPLLLLWFGIGPNFKIVLVAVSVFFFVFFNTFAGARDLDNDLVGSLRIMGASWPDVFIKVTMPASVDWIFTGIKVAAPYALAAAVVGEMLVAHAGLGQLLVRATQMNDMARLYAVLLIIMAIGIVFAEGINRMERLIMRRQGRTLNV